MIGKWIHHVADGEWFEGRVVSMIGESFIEVAFVYLDEDGKSVERPDDPPHTFLLSLHSIVDGEQAIFFDSMEEMFAWRCSTRRQISADEKRSRFEVVQPTNPTEH